MPATWDHLEPTVKRLVTKKADEYKEQLRSVYTTDGRLHLFGVRNVEGQSWRNTLLLGSYATEYDTAGGQQRWTAPVEFGPLDRDDQHEDHLFAVGPAVFLFVHSVHGRGYRLLRWTGRDWSQEVQIERDEARDEEIYCEKATPKKNLNYKFFAAKDGFYFTLEGVRATYVARLTVDLDAASGRVRKAQCVYLAKFDMLEQFHEGGHVTALAYSADRSTIYLWGGMQGCGFMWMPNRVLTARVDEPGRLVELAPRQPPLPDPHPPFDLGGPRFSVQFGDRLVMLGGGAKVGLSQCRDVPEVWLFDGAAGGLFRRGAADLPPDVGLHSASVAVDYASGDIYLCDAKKGIFRINYEKL